MSEIEIRISWGLGDLLRKIVYRKGRHEFVAFGLVGHAHLGGKDVLLLRHVLPIPDDAYRESHVHGAVWGGSAMFPIIERAMQEDLGIVLFHSHTHEGPPSLSSDDLESARRLLPMFQARVPGRPHGSVVLSRTHAEGLIMMPNESLPRTGISVRWFGSAIETWVSAKEVLAATKTRKQFHRQVLAVGSAGQARIESARVAVIGLSGGGSHVVQQLAHLGVGDIVGIDRERLEWTNQHRVVGVSRWDYLFRSKKIDAFRRMVRRIGTGSRFTGIAERVPHAKTIEALRGVDVIVGCPDNLHARADLQEIATRFLIPYVDIGVNIRTMEAEGSEPASIGGNVITYTPGSFCLWCCGFLSKEKLDLELDGPERSYFAGGGPPEAQVVSFNGLVASQAVNEVLQLLTGYSNRGLALTSRDPDLLRGFKKFSGTHGTLDDWGAKKRPGCSHCETTFAQGDPVWK